MSARDTLTPELRAEVLRLEDDLRARVASLPEAQSAWRAEYDAARAAERTAAAWEAWVDERVTLAAVAWVLTTVFIRFCEDNGLVKPVWLSGPRNREAIDAQQQFLRETARANPDVTDREWLLEAVEHLKSLPATAGLVDDTSPMWLVSPSGDAATRLLNFWRERDETGALIRDLSDPDLDTRFLGDLYQEISEDAKKRYALLQTPAFVEEFILDRTLEPALNERPLDGFKMIDPTCGSGHFLLGGFQRLLDRWHKHAPGLDERERVQAALNSVYGVDINPFAVAIARFRLTVAALEACGLTSLENAPSFKYHLAAGDSLLHGLDQGELELGAEFSVDKVASSFAYETENLGALRAILRNGQYDCVVGNPPYVTVKDPGLNELYRRAYTYCKGSYALTVPFMERFFSLARSGSQAGWVGQITGNGFLKRGFGAPLVERFFPSIDLRLVVDSAGAYIPGHGTPTVIIVGRNAAPSGGSVRVVVGDRSEPGQPTDPRRGTAWVSLTSHVDESGWTNEFAQVRDVERQRLAVHPLALSTGSIDDLVRAMTGTITVGSYATVLGYSGQTNADSAFLAPREAFARRGVDAGWSRPFVAGEDVRDYRIDPTNWVLFPYNDKGLRTLDEGSAAYKWLWPVRTNTWARATFSKDTYKGEGRTWWEWHQISLGRLAVQLSIGYPNVATHNHFVVDDQQRIFNPTAQYIQLKPDVSLVDHQAIAAVLSSSISCFWLKQNSQNKAGSGIGRGIQPEPWMNRYAFNGVTVKGLPLPSELPRRRSEVIASLCDALVAASPATFIGGGRFSRLELDQKRADFSKARGRMIAEQEELDWEIYKLYGLLDEDLTHASEDLPELALGERAFEIVLARRAAGTGEKTAWFERHASTPLTEVPSHWPQDYRELVRKRIELIESHPFIRLLEKPENKRRWQPDPWEAQEERAIRRWLLDRLEGERFWFDVQGRPTPKSIGVLADEVARDGQMVRALELWEGRPDVDLAGSLGKLIVAEGVPFLSAHRYKDSGLRKRKAWEHVWALQRREDAGTYDATPTERGGDGPVPVPPAYTSADFVRPEYWSHRGKFDVPKEQFVLYPGAGHEGDATPVLGWAGWDHAQQALALATLIQSGEQQGWSEERLIPFVAGVSELLPWVEQWHTDPEPLYGGSSPAEFFSGLLDNYMARLGATRESLAAWRPPAPTRGRKAKS